eukprot:Ihof_evm4s607 gene=Ihof_evmTU4s607
MADLTEVLKELTPFLTSPNPQMRAVAVSNMFALTGTEDYMPFFRSHHDAVDSFTNVVRLDPVVPIKRDAFSALVNLLADNVIADALAERQPNLIKELCDEILNVDSLLADSAAAALANYTRASERACVALIQAHGEEEEKQSNGTLYRLLNAFCNEKYNKCNQGLHWLAAVFSNITQQMIGRSAVTDKNRFAIQRLLSFIQHPESIRRGGVVGTVRNCCFDTGLHQWLMGPDVDILPALLLPLAGPEELSEEDMEGMPDELQYLPEDKEREVDPAVRKMLLEALLQLAATKKGRMVLRQKAVYPIIRNYHRWETNPGLEKPIYDLIDILIAEEDPTDDNLKEMDLPTVVK